MARPQVADGGVGFQIWRLAANILNKQSRTADRGWSSSLGVLHGANNSTRYRKLDPKIHKKPQTWTDYLDNGFKRKKMDLRFGTWNVRSIYRAGSLRTMADVVSKYKLDLVGVQEVRWDRGGTEPTGQYTFFCGKEN
jgi:hypothetical protein